MQELDLITKLRVSPQAFIWVHAQNEKNKELHIQAAERGCWVEFDGIGSRSKQLLLLDPMNLKTQFCSAFLRLITSQ